MRKDVCLQYLPDTTAGEYVIVHVGFAIQRLDEQSALETLATIARMGLLAEELDGGPATSARDAQPEGVNR